MEASKLFHKLAKGINILFGHPFLPEGFIHALVRPAGDDGEPAGDKLVLNVGNRGAIFDVATANMVVTDADIKQLVDVKMAAHVLQTIGPGRGWEQGEGPAQWKEGKCLLCGRGEEAPAEPESKGEQNNGNYGSR